MIVLCSPSSPNSLRTSPRVHSPNTVTRMFSHHVLCIHLELFFIFFMFLLGLSMLIPLYLSC